MPADRDRTSQDLIDRALDTMDSHVLVAGPPGIGRTTVLGLADRTARSRGLRRMALSGDIQRLIQRLADPEPTVVTIDDLQQWCAESRALLAEMLPAAAAAGVVVVMAWAGEPRAGDWDDTVRVHVLEPLGARDSISLLAGLSPYLPARERFEVLRLAEGNPRAVVELHDAYARGVPGPDGSRVPDTTAVQARFAVEFDALPGATTRAIRAAAAALPDEDLTAVLTAALTGRTSTGPNPAVLAPAEHRGLITVRDATARFPDPLVRLAALWSTPAACQIDLRRELASLTANPVHRAWYRSKAGVGGPRQIVADLELVATAAPDGRTDDIVALWERAAELSPPGDGAARRLLYATISAAGLGDPARVGALHRRLTAATDDRGILAASTSVVAVAMARCGLPEDARAFLDRAEHPALVAERITSRSATVETAWYQAQLDAFPEHAGADPEDLEPILRRCRRYGGVGLGAEAAVSYAEHLVNAARWTEALDLIDELECWAATGGWSGVEVDAAALRATAYAFRGDQEAATAVLSRVWHRIDLPGNPASHVRLLRASSVTAMVGGDWAGAYRHLRAMFDESGRPMHPVQSVYCIAELATAATRSGARDEVAGIVEAMQAAHAGTSSTRLRLLLHQAAALVLDENVESHHRLAVVDPAGERWPLERAVARIRYGEWLRRKRRPLDARAVIQAALVTLERFGPPMLVEITRNELRATGHVFPSEKADDAQDGPLAGLTPQERQVVTLAAQGLRNRAIAEQLFISARTVAFHLYKAYPKLGVEGRHQLASVIAS